MRQMYNTKYRDEEIPFHDAEIQRLRIEVNGLGVGFEVARSIGGVRAHGLRRDIRERYVKMLRLCRELT